MVRELEWGSWWGPGRKGGELVGELVRSREKGGRVSWYARVTLKVS